MREELGPEDFAADADGLREAPAPFVRRTIIERLQARPLRDAAFARQVKAAYDNTCAMTGLRIRNGGGRPEVQAAHVRPDGHDGPDTPRNGVALSRTAHWMFDRGLVSVDDDHGLLVAEDRLPPGASRLWRPDRRLLLPRKAGERPHPIHLRWRRENLFKG